VSVHVHPDPEALARALAERFAAALEAAAGAFSVALSGGSTPRRLFAELARRPELPWAKARLYLGDERALPASNPDSNAHMVKEALTEPLGLDAAQVILPDGGAADLSREAQRYADRLAADLGAPPVFDLVLLGMGADGHTASLFPGEPEPSGWYAATRAPADTASQHRLTVSPAVVQAAREVWVIVAGAAKAGRLADVVAGRDAGPLARVIAGRPGPTLWMLDEAAARDLEEIAHD